MNTKKLSFLNGLILGIFYCIPMLWISLKSASNFFSLFHFYFLFLFFNYPILKFLEFFKLSMEIGGIIASGLGFVFYFFFGYFLTYLISKKIKSRVLVSLYVYLSVPIVSLLMLGVTFFVK